MHMAKNEIVTSLTQPLNNVLALLEKFIQVCPEDIWMKNFGGWPVWQQLHHAYISVDFFVAAPGAKPCGGLTAPEYGNLSEPLSDPSAAPSKEAMKGLAERMKANIQAYTDGLTDDRLPELNQGLEERAPLGLSHAATMTMLAAHMLYHLGACDAALRESGRPGVF